LKAVTGTACEGTLADLLVNDSYKNVIFFMNCGK